MQATICKKSVTMNEIAAALYFSEAGNLRLHSFRQTFQHQVVGVVDHFTELFSGQATIGLRGVPMLFIHMVAGAHFGIAFAELYGPFGIAFYVETCAVRNTCEQEKLFAHFKHQSVLAKGKSLGYARLRKAIIT